MVVRIACSSLCEVSPDKEILRFNAKEKRIVPEGTEGELVGGNLDLGTAWVRIGNSVISIDNALIQQLDFFEEFPEISTATH